MITLATATSRVAESLKKLAPQELEALKEATRGGHPHEENIKIGLIAKMLKGQPIRHNDAVRLYYHTIKELPAAAELLRAELQLLDVIHKKK